MEDPRRPYIVNPKQYKRIIIRREQRAAARLQWEKRLLSEPRLAAKLEHRRAIEAKRRQKALQQDRDGMGRFGLLKRMRSNDDEEDEDEEQLEGKEVEADEDEKHSKHQSWITEVQDDELRECENGGLYSLNQSRDCYGREQEIEQIDLVGSNPACELSEAQSEKLDDLASLPSHMFSSSSEEVASDCTDLDRWLSGIESSDET